MAAPIIVNASTSAVLIDTSLLTAQTPNAVVLLSSVLPGRTVTIRDSTGYLSTPLSIIVSTVGGIAFADGTSSVTITNPFGYLSVTSRDATSWLLTNSFAFPQNQSVASVSSLTTDSITTRTIVGDQVSTNYLTAIGALTSTLACSGPAQFGSLVVGPPFTPVPGATVTVYGSMDISGAATFGGALSTATVSTGTISTGAITGTSLNILNNLFVGGNIFSPNNAAISAIRITTSSAVFENFTTSTLSSQTITTSTLNTQIATVDDLAVANQIRLQSMTITPSSGIMVFSAGLATPSVSTGSVNASGIISTVTLTVDRTIQAQGLSTFELTGTQILNPDGLLVISSIVTNTATIPTVNAGSVNTANITASTIALANDFLQPAMGYMTFDTAITSTLSTQNFYGDSMYVNTFSVSSVISVRNLNVTGNFTGATTTSIFAPNATIQASSIVASSILTRSVSTADIYIASGRISSGTSTLTIEAPFLNVSTLSTATIQASQISASTITVNQITLGTAVDSTIRGPYFVCTGSTNCVVSGTGDYYSPLFVTNLKPAEYVAGTTYAVDATFQYIIPGGYLPENIIRIEDTLLWGNELEANSFVSNEQSTIISMYGYYAEDQTSNVNRIQQYTNLSTNAYRITASMINDSAVHVIMQTESNTNYSQIDPSVYINMQNGILKWNYALNGTTIQNSLNDIATRNLLYYGSLNFISDPRMKKNIELADTRRCYDIIRDIPLRRYEFVDSYVSTFRVTDIHRLGVIADEYEVFFPKSITTQASPVSGLSSIKTIDTQQLDMAHLGATQYLLKEVEELRRKLEGHNR